MDIIQPQRRAHLQIVLRRLAADNVNPHVLVKRTGGVHQDVEALSVDKLADGQYHPLFRDAQFLFQRLLFIGGGNGREDILLKHGGEGIKMNAAFLRPIVDEEFRGVPPRAEPLVRLAHQRLLEQILYLPLLPDQAAVHFHVKGNFPSAQPPHRKDRRGRGIAAYHDGVVGLFQPFDHIQTQVFVQKMADAPRQLHRAVSAAPGNEPVGAAVFLVFHPVGEQHRHVHALCQLIVKMNPVGGSVVRQEQHSFHTVVTSQCQSPKSICTI